MSFAQLASKMATKGRQATVKLTMLRNTTRDIDLSIIPKAIHAYILAISTYKAPAWCRECLRKDKKGRYLKNGLERHCRKLNKALNVALHTILPV